MARQILSQIPIVGSAFSHHSITPLLRRSNAFADAGIQNIVAKIHFLEIYKTI
jgi:hypothetical protein